MLLADNDEMREFLRQLKQELSSDNRQMLGEFKSALDSTLKNLASGMTAIFDKGMAELTRDLKKSIPKTAKVNLGPDFQKAMIGVVATFAATQAKYGVDKVAEDMGKTERARISANRDKYAERQKTLRAPEETKQIKAIAKAEAKRAAAAENVEKLRNARAHEKHLDKRYAFRKAQELENTRKEREQIRNATAQINRTANEDNAHARKVQADLAWEQRVSIQAARDARTRSRVFFEQARMGAVDPRLRMSLLKIGSRYSPKTGKVAAGQPGVSPNQFLDEQYLLQPVMGKVAQMWEQHAVGMGYTENDPRTQAIGSLGAQTLLRMGGGSLSGAISAIGQAASRRGAPEELLLLSDAISNRIESLRNKSPEEINLADKSIQELSQMIVQAMTVMAPKGTVLQQYQKNPEGFMNALIQNVKGTNRGAPTAAALTYMAFPYTKLMTPAGENGTYTPGQKLGSLALSTGSRLLGSLFPSLSGGIGASAEMAAGAGGAGMGFLGALGGIAGIIGNAILTAVGSEMIQGAKNGLLEGVSLSPTYRMLGGNSLANQFTNRINAIGAQSVENWQQISGNADLLGSLIGNRKPLLPTLAQLTTGGLGLGLSGQSMIQGFGSMFQSGAFNGQNVTAKEFADLIGAAVSDAQMQGRQGEVLQALVSATQQVGQTLVGVPWKNILGVQTALNATGLQAFMGQNGASIMQGIAQGMANPGLGAAGQLLNFRLLNPTGKLNLWQTLASAQAGPYFTMPKSLGGTGVPNISLYLGGLVKSLGVKPSDFSGAAYSFTPTSNTGGLAENLLSNMTNGALSLSQSAALLKLYSQNPGMASNMFTRAIQQVQSMGKGLVAAPESALGVFSYLYGASSDLSGGKSRAAASMLKSAATQVYQLTGQNPNLTGVGTLTQIASENLSNRQIAKGITDLESYIKRHSGQFLTPAQNVQQKQIEWQNTMIQIGQGILSAVNFIAGKEGYNKSTLYHGNYETSINQIPQSSVPPLNYPTAGAFKTGGGSVGMSTLSKDALAAAHGNVQLAKAFIAWGDKETGFRYQSNPNTASFTPSNPNPYGLGFKGVGKGYEQVGNLTQGLGSLMTFLSHNRGPSYDYQKALELLPKAGKMISYRVSSSSPVLSRFMGGSQVVTEPGIWWAAYFAQMGGFSGHPGNSATAVRSAVEYANEVARYYKGIHLTINPTRSKKKVTVRVPAPVHRASGVR